ncbi:MAG: hypothetical protein ABIG63_07900 [Chloroflexota bacterium]
MKTQKLFCARLLSLLTMTAIFLLGCGSGSSDNGSDTPTKTTDVERPAVTNLIEGWTHDVLYSNTCVSPTGMTAGEDGTMYINERCGYRILKLTTDGVISSWANTDLSMDGIVYQPNKKRLIGIVGNNLYEITPTATASVGSFSDSLPASAIIVDPRDDSLYAVAWEEEATIRLYDSNFTLIRTVQNVDYCLNMALDHTNDILYYTESAAQTVTSYNLSSGVSQVIRSQIGNGWNDENIGVAVDTSGTVYYASLTDGLYRYDVTSGLEERLMEIPLGVGSIYWWNTEGIILQTNVFAGTIVKMDPTKTEAELMEPNVNTHALVARSNGKIFYYSESQLYSLEDSIVSKIGSTLEDNPGSLALDHLDNLYISVGDRTIYLVDESTGIIEPKVILDDGNMIMRIEYDFLNNEMVVLSRVNSVPAGNNQDFDAGASSETVAIWRTSVVAGSTPRQLKRIDLEDSHDTAIMVDRRKGDIYFYNRIVNKLSKLNETSKTLETIYSNVVPENVTMVAGLNFFSPLNSFIITNNDMSMELWPMNGTGKQVFATIGCGMDSAQGYEDANGYYYAAHSGQIFRIRPDW